MTDNEIIKALECCRSEDADMCRICPFHSDTYSGCWYELHKDALDLIKRQKAEIERLKEDFEYLNAQYLMADMTIEQERKNAVKEFAEIIKQNKDVLFNLICSRIGFDILIDRLAKERVGDADD